MGATLGYLESGEIPFFKIYDHENESILPLETSNLYYSEYLDDLNGNGVWDQGSAAEPFTDIDGDGLWDDSEYFEDDNGNGVWDQASEAEPFEGSAE